MTNTYRGTIPYRTLGRGGFEVSEMGLGCWAIGSQSAYSYAEFVRVCPTTQPDVIQFNYHALGTPFDTPDADLIGWAEEQNLGMGMFESLAHDVLLDKFDPDNAPRFGVGDIRAGQPMFGGRSCTIFTRGWRASKSASAMRPKTLCA